MRSIKSGTVPRTSWYENLSLSEYVNPMEPAAILFLRQAFGGFYAPEEQRILRMMVRRPRGDLVLPQELQWLEFPIRVATSFQKSFDLYDDRFVYVTVRCGEVTSKTDDIWHADGFSMRTPHLPEQNYLWANHSGTQYLQQAFDIPADFDPMRHNLHTYFNDRAESSAITAVDHEWMYLIDPYVVHRRPPYCEGMHRKMFRISFVPIEIEDDTCTQNPLLPSGPYNREDIRKILERY